MVSDQCLLYWLTRSFWSIICPIRCMESAMYQYNWPTFPGCLSTSIALYIINCRSMRFSLRLEAAAGISAEVKRYPDGDSFDSEAFLLPALIQTISIASIKVITTLG